MSYTKTSIKIPTFRDGKRAWIVVDDDMEVYFFRGNMINKTKAWQCNPDEYYFKSEEDVKAYAIYINRDNRLNDLGI